MPTWPADLPQKLENPGYAEGLPELLRSSNAGGAQTRRRRSTATPRPLRATMLLSHFQWKRLMVFHDFELSSGALSFDFPDPFPEPGQEAGTIRLVFDQPPTRTQDGLGGDVYRATLQFLILAK